MGSSHLQRTLLYFHENQFAYPDQSSAGLVERQLTSIYSAMAADSIAFNSNLIEKLLYRGQSPT